MTKRQRRRVIKDFFLNLNKREKLTNAELCNKLNDAGVKTYYGKSFNLGTTSKYRIMFGHRLNAPSSRIKSLTVSDTIPRDERLELIGIAVGLKTLSKENKLAIIKELM